MHRVAGFLAASVVLMASSQGAGAVTQPHLQSVVPHHGYLSLSFTVGDLVPVQVQVGSSAETIVSGSFAGTRIKLRERMSLAGAAPVLRWRTQTALPRGVYYVHVAAAETGGVTSCSPRISSCALRWSNVVRVTVTG
jgi:hypothetical protein